MAKRVVHVGLATYRRADVPDLWAYAMRGESVDVHDDDIERFEGLNAPGPRPAPEPEPTPAPNPQRRQRK